MEKLKWKPEYFLNIKELDEQHRAFIELLNKLIDAKEAGVDEKQIAEAMEAIEGHTQNHFETEENLFNLFSYEDAKNHKEKHDNFKAKVLAIIERYKNGEDVFDEGIKLVSDWVNTHIVECDKKYEKCFHEHGLF